MLALFVVLFFVTIIAIVVLAPKFRAGSSRSGVDLYDDLNDDRVPFRRNYVLERHMTDPLDGNYMSDH